MTEKTFEHVSLDSVDLPILIDQALKIQEKCKDYNVSNVSSENATYLGDLCSLRFFPDEGGRKDLEFTEYSLNQFCSKIGVPTKYIDKCIDSGRLELAEDNINSWMESYNKNLLIREYDNKIRGVLSDRYSILDTPSILEVVEDTITDKNDWSIKGSYISSERMHVRIVKKERIDISGEDLFAGIQIDSSDVGRALLSVKFFIYKQVCTNGLIVPQLGGSMFHKKHIGMQGYAFKDELADSLLGVNTLVENSVSLIEQVRKDGLFNFKSFTESQMEQFVSKINDAIHVSRSTVDKIVTLSSERYGGSTWGLINALTEVAQEYTLEKRLEIEKFAGSLLVA